MMISIQVNVIKQSFIVIAQGNLMLNIATNITRNAPLFKKSGLNFKNHVRTLFKACVDTTSKNFEIKTALCGSNSK